MRHTAITVSTATAIAVVLGSLSLSIPTVSQAESSVDEGKKIAFDRKKGNCLACHQIEGGSLPGNIGPPLIAMKARFPDKQVLKAQISNPQKNNPNTIMPPFGPHEILSAGEIDMVVEFIHTL
ncbi:MAG: sulfur oxidation c-type cytochrome SoxX [Gammaproteobacteria bacterium]|nr:sulfur oxidation c-type cytochrome SoxX [Gammaproteobacteria bacterium]MDH5735491.1 sulfur oxidation c-type cytochrome SoxX [Gammaproteobacteria bacterium]